MMGRRIYIFHIDANSAFLSWTAAYRVKILGEKEDLRDIPSIIGGDQEKRHGIVLAKSIPAKKYGIQTGEAIVTARQKCPNLVVVPPDYGLYGKASRAFLSKLKQYSDRVIQYSIDEAWCVLDGFEDLYGRGQMKSFAYHLKNEIRDELGFTVNIGISTNFLLSKMAGDFSKPDKVHTLFPDEIEKKMWPLPLNRTVDSIRKRYGEDAVFRASFLKSNVSHMSGGPDQEHIDDDTAGDRKSRCFAMPP